MLSAHKKTMTEAVGALYQPIKRRVVCVARPIEQTRTKTLEHVHLVTHEQAK